MTAESRTDTKTRVDIIHSYERTLRTVKRWLRILVVSTLALAAFTYYLDQDQTGEIQDQRRDTIITACQEQNARHDATLEQLDVLISKIPKSDPRHDRAQQSRASTALLIDALAPVRDCEARARKFVK